MAFLSANILICETVLTEKTDVLSAIRMMDTIKIAPGNNSVHFYSMTRVSSMPGDFDPHVLKVQVTHQNGTLITEAPEHRFQYGYRMDLGGPGGFILTTEFTIGIETLPLPAGCLVTANLDGKSVARMPFMLRR
ncbi:MAG TPA: hypothetical protein VME17_19100 [Bryobacteraceae bacterium]|nr:hypothetical protein [Bryobacteraceae bacterium]